MRAILAVAQAVVRPLSPAPDAAVSRQREAVQGARRHGNDAPPRASASTLSGKSWLESVPVRGELLAVGGSRKEDGRRRGSAVQPLVPPAPQVALRLTRPPLLSSHTC